MINVVLLKWICLRSTRQKTTLQQHCYDYLTTQQHTGVSFLWVLSIDKKEKVNSYEKARSGGVFLWGRGRSSPVPLCKSNLFKNSN